MPLMQFRHLPAGEVELHDARRKRRWSVHLEPFAIGITPVTAAQYAHVTQTSEASSPTPVTELSWLDAVTFCNLASAHEGLPQAYSLEGEEVTWNINAEGYRLPTEAEWEYACRAGTSGPHYGALDRVAWTANDDVPSPQPVGLKLPNQFGLYDTLGNVWEWCWDFLDPARYGDYRVFRGGGFADERWSARASTRRGGAPGMTHPDLGLRLARGGFTGVDAAQGWSAQADAHRSAAVGALPSGWTPRANT